MSERNWRTKFRKQNGPILELWASINMETLCAMSGQEEVCMNPFQMAKQEPKSVGMDLRSTTLDVCGRCDM